MTFTQFTAFAAVAKHLNVTKAANMLHVSQPSLSKHLKALEENFSLRLFTRHPKGIRLTDEGYEFFHDIEPILAQLEKINQRYRSGTASKHSGPLKVGGTYGPASRILPSLLTEFKKSYPKVDVTLRANSGGIIHQKILQADLEIAVCSRAPAPSSMLYSEPYLPMKLVAFVARNDPSARKKELTLAELEDIPLVVRSNGGSESTTQSLLVALKRPGHKINIAMACESPEAIKRAVSQRLGVGFLYYDAVRDDIERGSFKILNIRGLELVGQTYIIYHKERPLSPNAAEFLKLLRDWRDQQKINA
jgi:DNA-binding transcriptional LysR family regulator